MALGDVIGRPLVNPLEGLGAGVQAGFEIAQGQERLRIANEELGLKKQQVESEYLAKGISAMSALAKAKGASRKVIGDVMLKYFANGNLRLNPETAKILSSDTEYAKKITDVLDDMDRQGITDSQRRMAFLQGVVDADPDQIDTQIEVEKLKLKAQAESQAFMGKEVLKGAIEAGRTQAKQTFEAKQKQEEQILELAKVPRSPKIAEFAAKLPREQQAGYLAAYDTGAGLRVNALRDALSIKGKPTAPGFAGKRGKALSLLNQVDDAWTSGDRQKADSLLNEAEIIAGDIAAAQKPANQQITPGQQAGLDMQFSRLVNDRTDKVTKGVSEAFGTYDVLKQELNNPEGADLGRVYALAGQIAKSVSAEGGVKTEGDIARILGSTLGLDIKKLLRYMGGEDVKLPEGEKKKLSGLVGNFEKQLRAQVKLRLDKTYKNLEIDPIVTGDPRRSQFVQQHKKNSYGAFGIEEETEKKKEEFAPTPSGKPSAPSGDKGKQAEQQKALKPLPSAAVINGIRSKLSSGQSLKAYLQSKGYDTSSLKE